MGFLHVLRCGGGISEEVIISGFGIADSFLLPYDARRMLFNLYLRVLYLERFDIIQLFTSL